MFTLSTPHFQSSHFSTAFSSFHQNVPVFESMSGSGSSHTRSPSSNYQTPRWKHATVPQRQTFRQSSSQRRESRNAALLQGVQERRQNTRDQTRSEQILRSDILAEQRAWEQAQEAEAARWSIQEEDEMYAQSDAELEEYLRREEEELQARADQAMQDSAMDRGGEEFGSEIDDDFDILILEAVEEFERSEQDEQRDMDLS